VKAGGIKRYLLDEKKRRYKMRIFLSLIAIALFMTGCTTSTRSISQYQYGYNPSYQGEMSQLNFIKEVSSSKATGSTEPINISSGERVMVMQSGQLYPDASLLVNLEPNCNIIPMSGIPNKDSVPDITLLDAAKAGGVTKIIAYWGNIETSIKPKESKAVSWIPIAGYYVPDENQRMRVSVSAIVSDVSTGRWFNFTAHSSETEISHSNYTAYRKDGEHVEKLKAEAYGRLVQKLVKKK
jgi:hypothetical protein